MSEAVHTLLAHYNFFGAWSKKLQGKLAAGGPPVLVEIQAGLPRDALAQADKQMAILEALQISVLTYWQLPAWLGDSLNPPALLFVRGQTELVYEEGWAVIGSRRAPAAAKAWAYRFAKALSEQGHLIISGGACGVDGAGHCGALAGCGQTIAWLGVAADRIYPAAHRGLFLSILAQGGALVSEIPPLVKSWPSAHAQRNRFIAGQAQNLMIVSAGLRSGSLGTARWAEKEGKMIWVPEERFNSAADGLEQLLRRGSAAFWPC
jgi:DNA processing protein